MLEKRKNMGEFRKFHQGEASVRIEKKKGKKDEM